MMVWALSTGRSPRRIHRPSRRGRNHNINIWSKSHEQSIDLGVGEWRLSQDGAGVDDGH